MSVIVKRLSDVTVGDLRTVLHMLSTMPAVSDDVLLRDAFGFPAEEQPEDLAQVLGAQIGRLGKFILENIPGEPSRDHEGAVDVAIRLLSSLFAQRESQLVRNVFLHSAEAASADPSGDVPLVSR